MHYRHFLVKEEDCDYQLREIDTAVANGIRLFGTITGQSYTVTVGKCTFYFMNTSISLQQANTIASELAEDILEANR